MHKVVVLCLISFLSCLSITVEAQAVVVNSTQIQQKQTSEKMQTLRVMISKLRDLVYNLRDINALEDIGMPRRDVLLMKNALQEKVNQMQGETVAFIRRL